MCTDFECPSAELCYRFMALPCKIMQTYFKPNRVPGAEYCNYFMRIEKGDILKGKEK